MKLLQSITGHGRNILRLSRRCHSAAQSEDYMKRNYANNVSEYNSVVDSLNARRRPYLLRDVYDDMMLDGIQPTRDMTAAGLGLNKFCYAGLIAAHTNKKPVAKDTAARVIELVEQSKGWASASDQGATSENGMLGVLQEELFNTPTVEYLHRRGFVDRRLTVYHAAFHALADLRDVKAIESLLKMLEQDNSQPDIFIIMQVIRCYMRSGDFDGGLKKFEDFMNSGRAPFAELYVTLVEGAMLGHTPKGMQIAQDALVSMTSKNIFLNPKMGSDLLFIAAGEKTGGYTTANYLWDLMQARNIIPTRPAVEAYYAGLKEREIPSDDPRLLKVTEVMRKFQPRFNRRP